MHIRHEVITRSAGVGKSDELLIHVTPTSSSHLMSIIFEFFLFLLPFLTFSRVKLARTNLYLVATTLF